MNRVGSMLAEIARYLVPLAILGLGATVLTAVVARGKPAPPQQETRGSTAPLVETCPVERQSEGLDIDVDGLVVPYRELTLAAEVAGRVIKKTSSCKAGNYVQKGTLLLEIDPRDYKLEAGRLEKQLEQAEANLREIEVEEENARDLILLAEDSLRLQRNEVERLKKLTEKSYVTDSQLDQEHRNELAARNSLVSLQNQLRTLGAKRAGLESARDLNRVLLEKARLDLARTKITSPIDGIVVLDMVESDAYINRGEKLVTIEDTAKVEVLCNLRMDELFWILDQRKPKDENEDGQNTAGAAHENYQLPRTPATIYFDVAGRRYAWEGVLERYEGIGLDQDTRTVPCTVVVDRPGNYCQVVDGLKVDCHLREGPSALVRGMFVKLSIHARPQAELLRIPELALRPGNRVWRVRDGKLSVVQLQVVGNMKNWAIVQPKTEGQLAAGDSVVESPLAAVEEGMAVTEQKQQ